MSLQREVMYLEPQHVTKLNEVQVRYGFSNHSEANRFLLDNVDTDVIGEAAELKVWTELLKQTVAEANASIDRAEQSLDRTLAYFAERRAERRIKRESISHSQERVGSGEQGRTAG